MPTFTKLLDHLREVQTQIDAVDPNSIEAFDLKILSLQIERAINVSGFDPLADIPNVAVPDLTHLRELSAELKKSIQDEQKRTALLGKILGVAKGIAGIAGLPIP